MGLVQRASDYAHMKHAAADHFRKYTGEPYITHPSAVVTRLLRVTDDPEALAAAWLHDTVEDTDTTIEDIGDVFGPVVQRYVAFLTDVSILSDGNRAFRKMLDRRHIAVAPPIVKTVKISDLIDNSYSIIQNDRKFAKVYIAEKRLLLDEALESGDARLWCVADAIIKQYYRGNM